MLRRELLAQGYSELAIGRLVRDGVLIRIRHGAYAWAAHWEQLDEAGRYGLTGRAVLRQARTPVVLSHTSALPEYDVPLWGLDLSNVHVTRTDGLAGRREAGVRQHHGVVRAADFVVVNGVPVMNPARTALEIATLGNTEASLCVVNEMLHRKLTTPARLDAQYVEMAHWPEIRPAEIVLRLADGRFESIGETRTFWCCYVNSLPMPQPQFEIRDGSGRVVARVDFAWPELGAFLEFDGLIKYEKLLKPGQRASDVVIMEKQREELICRLTGWRCIRITWADLANPAQLAAKIMAVLFPSAA